MWGFGVELEEDAEAFNEHPDLEDEDEAADGEEEDVLIVPEGCEVDLHGPNGHGGHEEHG